MPINNITIESASGASYTTASLRIGVADGAGLSLSVGTGHVVTLSAEQNEVSDLFKQAYDTLVAEPWLARLNGIGPDSDGCFWLSGSSCITWTPRQQKSAATLSRQIRRNGHSYLLQAHDNVGGGFTVTDNCVSCADCSYYIYLKRWFEWLKARLNTLKDINIYEQNICDSRMAYLKSGRVDVPAACSAQVRARSTAYEDLDTAAIASKQLMGQYVTMVHMWNYAVSRNNEATDILLAPESSTGLIVQTKYSVPSCDGSASLVGSIEIESTEGNTQAGLSTYVTGSTAFEPFAGTGISDNAYELTIISPTHKKITTTFSDIRAAGTYSAQLKLMPFIYGYLTDSEGNRIDVLNPPSSVQKIIISGQDLSTSDSGLYEKYPLGYTFNTEVIADPTATDYNSGSLYPARYRGGNNRWHITVTWTLSGIYAEGAHVSSEEYYMETTALPEYVDNLTSDLILPVGP